VKNELGATYVEYLLLASKPTGPAVTLSARSCRPACGRRVGWRFLRRRPKAEKVAIDVAAMLAPYGLSE
jgi:hypothetical protein